MTKVHIAYDDGQLIGVFMKRKDAKRALNTSADEYMDAQCTQGERGRWMGVTNEIERTIRPSAGAIWVQWIYTHEVTK